MVFAPVARTPADEAARRYHYRGPSGELVTLATGRGHAERCAYGEVSEPWLNGWHRSGGTVLVGGGIHCAGCGKLHGAASVAISSDYTAPERLPDWPFRTEDCPVCADSEAYRFDAWPPRAADLYIRLRRAEVDAARADGEDGKR